MRWEDITLSEISQAQKDKYHLYSYTQNPKVTEARNTEDKVSGGMVTFWKLMKCDFTHTHGVKNAIYPHPGFLKCGPRYRSQGPAQIEHTVPASWPPPRHSRFRGGRRPPLFSCLTALLCACLSSKLSSSIWQILHFVFIYMKGEKNLFCSWILFSLHCDLRTGVTVEMTVCPSEVAQLTDGSGLCVFFNKC